MTALHGLHEPVYHTFPGDDELDYSVIWKTGLGWLAMGPILKAAADTFGVTVSEQTLERWHRIMALAHALDYLIDDPPPPDDPTRSQAYAYYEWAIGGTVQNAPTLPDGANPDLPVLVALFMGTTDQLGEDTVKSARIIMECAQVKNATKWVGTYIAQLRKECHATALLMTRLMTASEQAQPGFRRFERWAIKLTKFIVSADAWKDLPEDFAAKRTIVRPGFLNRCVLLGWVGIRLVAQLFHRNATAAALEYYRDMLRGEILPEWRALKAEALGADAPAQPLTDWGTT